jgi:uncharacterized protein YjbJ (UPF0337 family)
MSLKDKLENAGEEFTGKAKQAAGERTGDHDLEAEGHADEKSAQAKKLGEDVKDIFR